jgi:substrate import-associated zinc metallohydrolase lipoprotein
MEQQQQAKVIPIYAGTLQRGAFDPWGHARYGRPGAGRFGWLFMAIAANSRRVVLFLQRHAGKIMFFFFIVLLVSCKKSDDLGNVSDIPGLGGDTATNTAIDQWISDSLTVPYNVNAKYRWDQFDLDLNKTLTPPMESKIIPVLSAVKQVWIDTYVAEAGANFMKALIPKFFVLVGSASYNTDGTVTLGSAEGGREIVLYVLNDFVTKSMPGFVLADSTNLKQMFHTIEHEFGHILHQTVYYPVAFKSITVGFYTANWNNVSDADARRDGFVTAYAMSAPDEDFVEMISMMLTEGANGFDNIVNSIPPGISADGVLQADAQSKLRQKQAIVVGYFKDVWGIDFTSLQTRVRTQVLSLIQ